MPLPISSCGNSPCFMFALTLPQIHICTLFVVVFEYSLQYRIFVSQLYYEAILFYFILFFPSGRCGKENNAWKPINQAWYWSWAICIWSEFKLPLTNISPSQQKKIVPSMIFMFFYCLVHSHLYIFVGWIMLWWKVWNWKNKYGGTILQQLRRLGASLDWSREVSV